MRKFFTDTDTDTNTNTNTNTNTLRTTNKDARLIGDLTEAELAEVLRMALERAVQQATEQIAMSSQVRTTKQIGPRVGRTIRTPTGAVTFKG